MTDESQPISIEMTEVHQTPFKRLQSWRLRRMAEQGASHFASQFQLGDRDQNLGYSMFQSFVEQILREHKWKPNTAVVVAWAIYQGHDSYTVRKGHVYIPEQDEPIDPLNEGISLSGNTNLFGVSQVYQDIIGLQGNGQNRVYQVNEVKGTISLQRIYQVEL